ncbi:hypothetical protein K501DRAFT_311058 [Backusella circina FSU 941]|nr:hypothetical protein K501DRAFT_311058 [Backusella circina FSU 941]
MLLSIPLELLNRIHYFLDKASLLQLSLTSHYSYIQALPTLYAHLELGHYTHVRNLQSSKESNIKLSRALTHHTKILTLKSQQNNSYWRAHDLIKLLGNNSPIDRLTFHGFQMITTQNILEIMTALPRLKHLEFKYCFIVNRDKDRHVSIHQNYNNTIKDECSGVTTLSLVWTDFTAPAIDGILSFSKLDTIHLGSNRNKYDGINDYLVQSLYRRCPHIRNLTISIPCVEETTLSEVVCLYGNQLKYLSLQCDSPLLIQAIANHCHQVEYLELRGRSSNGSPSHEPFLDMIRDCKSLNTLKLTSFAVQDIPTVFWQRLVLIDEIKQKALDALEHIKTLQKKGEIDSNNNSIQQPQRRYGSSRIYHYAVTEESLAQRYSYNQNNNQPLVHRTDLKLSFPYTLI